MKPIIKVWCLPKLSEEVLKMLHQKIVAVVVEMKEFGLKDENDMVCLFPSDWMEYGLGNEIIIEVTLRNALRHVIVSRDVLALNLANMVYELFPEACVDCSVASVDYSAIGHATRGYDKGSSLTL